jgi:uncharacterized protein YjeT (DUF2065 family)
MKVLALVFLVTGIGVIAAPWLMIAEGMITLSRAKSRRMETALMRKVR